MRAEGRAVRTNRRGGQNPPQIRHRADVRNRLLKAWLLRGTEPGDSEQSQAPQRSCSVGSNAMSIRGFRYALIGCVAAALLADCGASQSQPPIGTQGPMPLQAQTRFGSTAAAIPGLKPALRSLGYKVTPPLLYVTNGNPFYNDVRIYQARAKDPAPLATISDGVNIPLGACIDGQGTLYVTNEPPSGPGWVSEYPLGETTPSKMITDGVNEPGFCAIDSHGNLWVANVGGPNVTEYLKGATKAHRVITSGLGYPIGIAIDRSGNLYVGNGFGAPAHNVKVYAPGSTSPSRTITDGATSPCGLAVDSNGTLYVANEFQSDVTEYRAGQDDPFQTITQSIKSPGGLTVDKRGILYVANLGNNTVVEFTLGSLTPLKWQFSKGLYYPTGIAYYPALLP
jgi:hypothetical protein